MIAGRHQPHSMETATPAPPEIAAQLDAARASLAAVRRRSGGARGRGRGRRTVAALTQDADLALGTLLHRVRRAGALREPPADRGARSARPRAGRNRTRAHGRASPACRLDRGAGPERAAGGDPAQDAAGRGRRSAPGGGASGRTAGRAARRAHSCGRRSGCGWRPRRARSSRRWPIAWVYGA